MFPVMLRVEGRRCLVVGGGGVALRKIQSLVAEGARVTVVTPEAVETLEEMAAGEQVTLERRTYRAGEAADYALVFAATDCRDVNRQVYDDADGAGVWANAADDPELCSFHLPARVQRGSLQIKEEARLPAKEAAAGALQQRRQCLLPRDRIRAALTARCVQ